MESMYLTCELSDMLLFAVVSVLTKKLHGTQKFLEKQYF
jgi:hypothetical protein